MSWALWTGGITLRWVANVTEWNWRFLLPVSAALQLTAFVIFFVTVKGHRPRPISAGRQAIETWMKLVASSTTAFLLALLMNQVVTIVLASTGARPEIPHWLDQRYLFLAAWGFPVLAVWGFNARWLPVFLGLAAPSDTGLLTALSACAGGVSAALLGHFLVATVMLLVASISASFALRVFRPSLKPAKIGVYAAITDSYGGIWGASRHSLTVRFLATMVFAIGQRVLPAFCGMRLLYSKTLMFGSLIILNLGCLLRVASEIPAYEGNLQAAWRLMPVSAMTELTAVVLFALNLGVTLLLPPPRPAVSRKSA